MAFWATLHTGMGGVTSADNEGIWGERSDALELVARKGAPAPGIASGAVFENFNIGHRPARLVNAANQVAFAATLRGNPLAASSRTNDGIWSEGSGSLQLVARKRTQAPGAPLGARFFAFDHLTFNDDGRVAFNADVEPNSEDGLPFNFRGIWSDRSGTLEMVASSLNQAPGAPLGAHFSSFGPVSMNRSNQIAFAANAGVAPLTGYSGIWSEVHGSLAPVAMTGEAAPGTAMGTRFVRFNSPRMTSSGKVAFDATIEGEGETMANNGGIWSDRDGALALVARLGSEAPGASPGTRLGSFVLNAFNDSGRVAFISTLQHGSGDVSTSDDTGVWSDGGGSLALVAREGSQAPGTPDGAYFSQFRSLSLNNANRVAFWATLQLGSGGVNPNNNWGLWAQDGFGDLALVARSGNLMEVAPGDFRTVVDLHLGGASTGDGRSPLASTDGITLGFYASFTDGSSGIFTATVQSRVVPEPAALWLVMPALLTIRAGRRQGNPTPGSAGWQ
ncbi:MAG TPA: hypothetical protein PKC18_14290 [Lacipirellulaceae bacterium]|nr:hypothetical protein [Lacipirellulaceae bacterium]